jgi:paraquat-inducible protein A
MPTRSILPPAREESGPLTCRLCGQVHREISLARGERAGCARCGSLLAKRGWFGADAPLAFTITGLALAGPALRLPLVAVSKLRNEHVASVITGVHALWERGMQLLAIWVLLCGVIAPVALLGTLGLLLAPEKLREAVPNPRLLVRFAHALEHWAMPEVHVLAVLVAFTKLGGLVDVRIGPGFWCYVAMSLMTLLAWRSFDFELPHPWAATGPAGQWPSSP